MAYIKNSLIMLRRWIADGSATTQQVLRVLDELIEEQGTPETNVGKWISVKDRLPEQWVNVLTFQPTLRITGDRLIRVGVYIGNNKWRESERHTMMEVPVTYWMPLPEPPKEEEHADGA